VQRVGSDGLRSQHRLRGWPPSTRPVLQVSRSCCFQQESDCSLTLLHRAASATVHLPGGDTQHDPLLVIDRDHGTRAGPPAPTIRARKHAAAVRMRQFL
jgi:hypothetical protein